MDYNRPNEWQFTVSWQEEGLSARSTDSHAALAVARYDMRRKNYKVNIVAGSLYDAGDVAPWPVDQPVLNSLRLATDVYYNQDNVEVIAGLHEGLGLHPNVKYVQLWFNGETPSDIVNGVVDNYHVCQEGDDDCIERNINRRNKKLKRYVSNVTARKKAGFGTIDKVENRLRKGQVPGPLINENLQIRGFNSVEADSSISMQKRSVKIKNIADAPDERRNDSGILRFEDGYVNQGDSGEFNSNIYTDVYVTSQSDGILRMELGDTSVPFLTAAQWIYPYQRSLKIAGEWAEVDLLYTPVFISLSSIPGTLWPDVSGTPTLSANAELKYLVGLYPDGLPKGEVIEPTVYSALVSNTPSLSSQFRINTLSAAAVHPLWNPSILTHVNFVSGGKIGSRDVISIAYNGVYLDYGVGIGDTTLLTYGDTLIEVNNAYNGAIMGFVTDDYEVASFQVDIENTEIALLARDVLAQTPATGQLQRLGFI